MDKSNDSCSITRISKTGKKNRTEFMTYLKNNKSQHFKPELTKKTIADTMVFHS